MSMFKSREDYETTMKMHELYEKEEEKYLEDMRQMEEESANFEMLEKERLHKERIRNIEKLFDEEECQHQEENTIK